MTTPSIAPARRTRERGQLWPALAIAALALAGGGAAYYSPPRTGEVAVVFAPGTSEVAAFSAILAAGGRFVSATRIPFITVAHATDPGFADRIRAAGGLFLLAAKGLCEAATPVPE